MPRLGWRCSQFIHPRSCVRVVAAIPRVSYRHMHVLGTSLPFELIPGWLRSRVSYLQDCGLLSPNELKLIESQCLSSYLGVNWAARYYATWCLNLMLEAARVLMRQAWKLSLQVVPTHDHVWAEEQAFRHSRVAMSFNYNVAGGYVLEGSSRGPQGIRSRCCRVVKFYSPL